jgi:hypothetical protein
MQLYDLQYFEVKYRNEHFDKDLPVWISETKSSAGMECRHIPVNFEHDLFQKTKLLDSKITCTPAKVGVRFKTWKGNLFELRKWNPGTRLLNNSLNRTSWLKLLNFMYDLIDFMRVWLWPWVRNVGQVLNKAKYFRYVKTFSQIYTMMEM